MEKFSITVASLPNRDQLVAEIFYEDVQWVEISQDTGKLIIEFYPHPTLECWQFPLDQALEALQKAKKRLVDLGPIRADYGRPDLM